MFTPELEVFSEVSGYPTNPTVPIELDEAQRLIDSRSGIVVGGGYTFLPGFYCAVGVLPGCLRGGDNPNLSTLPAMQWYTTNLQGLVLRKGFYPAPHFMGTLTRIQSELKDYSIDLDDMVRYCIDQSVTSGQLKEWVSLKQDAPHAFWAEYFRNHTPS